MPESSYGLLKYLMLFGTVHTKRTQRRNFATEDSAIRRSMCLRRRTWVLPESIEIYRKSIQSQLARRHAKVTLLEVGSGSHGISVTLPRISIYRSSLRRSYGTPSAALSGQGGRT